MELIDGIKTFVAVVETGSFTAAGQRLGISGKLASKYLAALEGRLGRPLLYRTTRAVSLTGAGAAWLPHARKVLAALDEADAALDETAGVLSGRLRITCGTTLGELLLADVVRDFTTHHPLVRVDLLLSDGFTDLAAGGFDLAVRIGAARDSSLRMQRLGLTRLRVAASPAYLTQHGTPQSIGALADHRILIDLNAEQPYRWGFTVDGAPQMVSVSGTMAVNSASVTIRHALAGAGLVRAPDIFLAPYLASGALVPVLDALAPEPLPVSLMTLPTGFRQSKIAGFAKVLKAYLRQLEHFKE